MKRRPILALAVLLVGLTPPPSWAAAPLRVLVTNDDGVDAAGIDALVSRLGGNRNLEIAVIAPATNQSGTGDRVTSGPLLVSTATTAGAFQALAVTGFPADTVLFGVLQALARPPDLVVSGINFGQNIAEFVNISGTVGAALWAARLGIPAIAASQGLGDPISYAEAAAFVADLVERFRARKSFRSRFREPGAPGRTLVLNVNFPTCPTGSTRGVRVVPLGRFSRITGYTLAAEGDGAQTWQPAVQNLNPFATDCTSGLGKPGTDLEALVNGFATVTPLGPDLTVSPRGLKRLRFLER
jgi:5'-nucleotidase